VAATCVARLSCSSVRPFSRAHSSGSHPVPFPPSPVTPRGRGVLVLSCSSQLLSAARAEREKGVRGDRRAQRRGKMRAWGGAKTDGGRRPDARVRPDVHALATPFRHALPPSAVSQQQRWHVHWHYYLKSSCVHLPTGMIDLLERTICPSLKSVRTEPVSCFLTLWSCLDVGMHPVLVVGRSAGVPGTRTVRHILLYIHSS